MRLLFLERYLRGYGVLLALSLLFGLPAIAQQEGRTVRIVVPAPPGGSLDGTGRILAQRLTAITGETHVVENRPGANTVIGVEHVVRAQPDGRTMLLTGGASLVINPLLQKLSFVPVEDLRPVIAVAFEQYALVGSVRLGLSSATGVEAAAAARPGGLNCAAPPGAMGMACEQLKFRLKGMVTSVPFAGVAPALNALAGGHVDLTFVPLATAGKLVDGKLAHILAVSQRPTGADALGAGTPLLTDLWPGFVLDAVTGIYLPAKTPETRVRELHRELAQVITEPESMARLRLLGQEIRPPGSPEDFTRLMESLSVRYGKIINDLGLGAP